MFGSLPPTAARLAREEMEQMGPVRLSDVESAQAHVAETVRRSLAGRFVGAGERVSEYLA